MEYYPKEKKIILNRKLSELDKFVLDFCRLLDDYALVSGYVSIIFGRSRGTEDVDLLIPKISFNEFKQLWKKIHENGFECINTEIPKEAFDILDESMIRFSRKGKAVPNMEVKAINDDIQKYSLKNKIIVELTKGELFISPLEMQIAYKLDLGKMGNGKDLEDAKHLYEIFKEKINKEELDRLIKEFKAEKEFEIIKKNHGTKYRKIR